MDKGYILLSRAILDSDVFASQKLLKIWVWCLCKANFKDRTLPLKIGKGETLVKVKRGSFLFGRFKAEEELCIDGSTVYKAIKNLEELGMISIESNSQYSVVTICNYDTYQQVENYKVASKEQVSNKQVTSNEQPCNTTNTLKALNTLKENNIYVYNSFYDNEIKNCNNDENYLGFVKILFAENDTGEALKNCLSIKKQVTYQGFAKVMEARKTSRRTLKDVLQSLENYKDCKKYSNLQLTLINWLKNSK